MQRIAMFGGSFNPIHKGHMALALSAAAATGAKVLLIPAYQPPHKSGADLADGRHRLEMCRLAAEGYPQLEASDLELRRAGPSFTVDTLTALSERYPGAALYLVCGADMLVTLWNWRRYDDILKLAAVTAVWRPGTAETDYAAAARRIRRDGGRVLLVEQEGVAVSSSAIRRRLEAGETADEWLPEPVAVYIRQRHLYERKGGV
ncbi:MAG: nicotinate (nicotinamide) nucleotide adenylyltransferase [Clostridiales bacterium]|nr:nicotinate (nicotinamide) nucleotide adenylyltransferase [Clostridiales bacterium]